MYYMALIFSTVGAMPVCADTPQRSGPQGGNLRGTILNKFPFATTAREVNNMSILEKTKHCTKRFPCRFKLAMMVFSVAVIISIITVPLIHSMA
jgi:hypothetical protein